jgi:hypothetical protein
VANPARRQAAGAETPAGAAAARDGFYNWLCVTTKVRACASVRAWGGSPWRGRKYPIKGFQYFYFKKL